MEKRKLFLLSTFAMLFTLTVNAQAPGIKFENDVYDFGSIQEEDGKVTTTFVFINDGDAPLIINDVSRACGCTNPEWTREPVPANGKGFIKVSYDPKNRPGPFSKSVSVKSNASEQPVVLRIKGEVILQKN